MFGKLKIEFNLLKSVPLLFLEYRNLVCNVDLIFIFENVYHSSILGLGFYYKRLNYFGYILNGIYDHLP
jgi:hypothetical protein